MRRPPTFTSRLFYFIYDSIKIWEVSGVNMACSSSHPLQLSAVKVSSNPNCKYGSSFISKGICRRSYVIICPSVCDDDTEIGYIFPVMAWCVYFLPCQCKSFPRVHPSRGIDHPIYGSVTACHTWGIDDCCKATFVETYSESPVELLNEVSYPVEVPFSCLFDTPTAVYHEDQIKVFVAGWTGKKKEKKGYH